MRPAREIVLVSLNLHGMKAHWWSRQSMVLAELEAQAPDVIAFQEVATWVPQARWLTWQINRRLVGGRRYRAFTARKRGWRGLFEGLSVITRLAVHERDTLDLLGDARVGQRLRLMTPDGELFDLFNVHLANRSDQDGLRLVQAGLLLGFLSSQASVPAVVVGDLNADPASTAVALVGEALQSAYRSVHGEEPSFTAPSYAEPGGGRVIDYVFVSDGVEVLSCDTCFGPVALADGSRYPSDHLGIVCRVTIHKTPG